MINILYIKYKRICVFMKIQCGLKDIKYSIKFLYKCKASELVGFFFWFSMRTCFGL